MRFTYFEDFQALVFPRTCCICNRSLFEFENQLCRICLSHLPLTNYHLRASDNDLKNKVMGLTEINSFLCFLRFTKSGMSQRMLHQLKYRNKPELGNVLGRIYGQILVEKYQGNWDAVVPVPLHPLKFKRRGYNQSERFSQGLAEVLNVPTATGLERIKFTDTQTNKNRLERWRNVERVFRVTPQYGFSGKRILLVDDVMTTGATLASCANVLLDAGVVSVDIAVIASGKR